MGISETKAELRRIGPINGEMWYKNPEVLRVLARKPKMELAMMIVEQAERFEMETAAREETQRMYRELQSEVKSLSDALERQKRGRDIQEACYDRKIAFFRGVIRTLGIQVGRDILAGLQDEGSADL